MSMARRLVTATTGLVALATAGGATYAVYALSTSTDAAFRDRATPSPVAAQPSPTVPGHPGRPAARAHRGDAHGHRASPHRSRSSRPATPA